MATRHPSTMTLDERFSRNDGLARNAHALRKWLNGDHAGSPVFELQLVGLDGTVSRVPVSKVPAPSGASASNGDAPHWRAHVSALPSGAYLGPRSGWDCRDPEAAESPRELIWVRGSALLVAALDTIEDALVIGVRGNNPREIVERAFALNPAAFRFDAPHFFLDPEDPRESADGESADPDFGRELVNHIERRHTGSVTCLRMKCDEPTLPSTLRRFTSFVADSIEAIRLGEKFDYAEEDDTRYVGRLTGPREHRLTV